MGETVGDVSPLTFACPVRWGDLDAQGHVNNSAYLDYLQEARVQFLLTRSVAMRDLLESGVLVVSHQVEYLRPIDFTGRQLEIRLWVDSVGGARFVIGYEIIDDDQLAARARTTVVPFDLASQQLRRLTTDERAELSESLTPAEPLRPVPTAPVGAEAHRYPLAVRWSDLDSYGHVNNVKYSDYVQEARVALINDALGWNPDDMWVIVRQDLSYLKLLDFRLEPYEVATTVTQIGTRSVTLSVTIRDPRSPGDPYATARTVLVGSTPLTRPQRTALVAHQTSGSLARATTAGEDRRVGH